LLDHPLQPVIGRRNAPTRWRKMTVVDVKNFLKAPTADVSSIMKITGTNTGDSAQGAQSEACPPKIRRVRRGGHCAKSAVAYPKSSLTSDQSRLRTVQFVGRPPAIHALTSSSGTASRDRMNSW
jgi:hypothetical protein